jgi:hypothetical protein
MKNLFDGTSAEEIKLRLAKLKPDSPRQWGKMNAAQAVAHCFKGLEMATGDLKPPRVFIGRILGPIVKPLALKDGEPMRKNSPTAPALVIADERSLESERQKLSELIDRFTQAGPKACTTHPHAFFGRLTPDEWSILMYKHLDHHLRQFGV